MKSLAVFQDDFQRAVVAGDDTVLEDIVDTSKENRRTLLGVYRNAYVLRLTDFLATDYEKVFAYLGDDQFRDMARAYINAHPSHTTNARWFGAKLPGFLRENEPYAGKPVLAELAGLELGLTDAFDAEDAPVLELSDLSAVAPENWANLTFTPHPATRRMDHSTNASDIWSALHNGETPPETERQEPRRIIFYRDDGMATFRAMAPDEAMMWDEAANGVPFSVLCEMLAMYAGEDEAPARAAGYLQGWIQSGALTKP